MGEFYIWETKDFNFQLEWQEGSTGSLNDLKDAIISFQQGKVLLEKDISSPDVGIDADENIIFVHLSQTDTGSFVEGKVKVQINLYYEDTERDATVKIELNVLDNLHKGVMK